MKQLTILCDLDGICTNLVQAVLDTYNVEEAESGQELGLADIKHYKLDKCFPNGAEIYKYLQRPNWFLDLPSIPGAVESLEDLQEKGHRLYILTSPGNVPTAAADKMRWVWRHMPFLPKRHIIVTPCKDMVRGDILIDDSPAHAKRYREAWPDSKVLGIEWPYNTEGPFHVLAPSCIEPELAWESIRRAIRHIAEGHEEKAALPA